MAQMIPNTLNSIKKGQNTITAGEHKTFKYLSGLSNKYYVWFDMGISNIEVYPDFILLSPDKGLLVLEVKDWSLKRIKQFTRERITMGTRSEKNPVIRSREYIELLLKELNKRAILKNSGGKYKGKLKFEWEYGVVFPNITREDFLNFEINGVFIKDIMDDSLIIFKDDLEKNIPEQQIAKYFTMNHKVMTKAQFYAIKRVIFPETVIPNKKLVMENGKDSVDLEATLDNPQEIIAKSIGEGRRLLHGIAGSGKTLIMLFRAKLISKINPDWKILFLCWNISLKSYLRDMFDEFEIEGDFENVDFFHFNGFLRHLSEKYNEPLPSLMDDDDDKIAIEFIDKIIAKHPQEKYQAVFIDEAQDFRGEYFKLVDYFIDKKTNSMIVCADEAQNIMKRSWDLLGIDESNIIDFSDIMSLEDNYSLEKNYRNTDQILKLAANIYDKKLPIRDGKNHKKHNDKIKRSKKTGDLPIIEAFDFEDDQYYSVGNWIKEMIIKKKMSYGDFLIIFPTDKHSVYPQIEGVLEEMKLPYYSVAKNIGSKINFDASTNKVKISTIASAKGMDFKAVALVNAEKTDNKYDDLKSMLYTGITRARDHLYITVKKNSKVHKLLKETYEKAFNQKTK
jgi:superfamily I DNA and RNA helicase